MRRSSNDLPHWSGPHDQLSRAAAVIAGCRLGGPWGRDLHTIEALADAGVGAIVLPSLFEEEIVAEEVGLSSALEAGSEHFAEALGYFPATPEFTGAADRYLETLQQAKKECKYSHHRKPQRHLHRRLGVLCQVAGRSRRRRYRVERLPGPH